MAPGCRNVGSRVFLCKNPKNLYICGMALVAMAIYDTPENGRDELTEACLETLLRPRISDEDHRHRWFFVVNASTERTRKALAEFAWHHRNPVEVIYKEKNVGTAKAVNAAWVHRLPGEYAVKMDNDVIIHQFDWLEQMEETMRKMPELGILGLKRKDLIQHPDHEDPRYRSTLQIVPHTPGEPWRFVEVTDDVMGTCTMFSPACLEKIGYLYQPGLYGFDDVLACVRSKVAGFENAFLHGIEIDHPDPGTGDYQIWKSRTAFEDAPEYARAKEAFESGTIPVYVNHDYE